VPEPPAGPSVAVIPARGGSKRIPRKNVRPLLGVPLLVRTLKVVQDCGVFDRVVVSTDDDEVAALARKAGAEVPFRRPPELSDDHTGTRPVIRHAIGELERHGGGPLALVCCVYATAVFITRADLVEARDLLVETEASFVFTVTTFPAPIQRALRRLPDGSCEMLEPEHRLTRSQDLEEAYHDAGQFYWGTRDAWLSDIPTFGRQSRLFVLPRWRVQDIDTPEDWQQAERTLLATDAGT
jgi:pseudaminic acid cytidylyltransferase